jgi:hypothetical protein
MPLQGPWSDPNTGASTGRAVTVVGEVQVDTRQRMGIAYVATYIGLAEYSAGKQPISGPDPRTIVMTGSAYLSIFDTPLRQRAQSYVAGLPEFSGAQLLP